MGVLDLGSMDDAYNEAEVQDFEEVPAGTYQVRVVNIEPTRSKSGSPMIKWTFVVLAGQYQGKKIFFNMVFTEKTLGVIKSNLQNVEYTGTIGELEERLPEFLNQAFEVRRSLGKPGPNGEPNFNTYLKKRINVPLDPGVDYSVPGMNEQPF